MYQYRQVLARMRSGDTDREIARSKTMGRRKVAWLRELAQRQGWLAEDAVLPGDEVLAAALGEPRRAGTTVSSLEPLREQIAQWIMARQSG